MGGKLLEETWPERDIQDVEFLLRVLAGEWAGAKWLSLPTRIAFVDIETTGLFADDRIVSMATLLLHTASLREGRVEVSSLSFECNPGRKSHPKALAVHGLSDEYLLTKEPFGSHAELVSDLLASASLIVAHNVSFDVPFIARELKGGKSHLPNLPTFCTMQAWRSVFGSPAKLDAVVREIGLARSGSNHGATEDAWLSMMVFLHLHGAPRGFMQALPADLR